MAERTDTPKTTVDTAELWRVSINDSCVGSGCCTGVAPNHFRLDANDRSHPVSETVAPSDSVLDAADLCPAAAILVLDARTGTVIGP